MTKGMSAWMDEQLLPTHPTSQLLSRRSSMATLAWGCMWVSRSTTKHTDASSKCCEVKSSICLLLDLTLIFRK